MRIPIWLKNKQYFSRLVLIQECEIEERRDKIVISDDDYCDYNTDDDDDEEEDDMDDEDSGDSGNGKAWINQIEYRNSHLHNEMPYW